MNLLAAERIKFLSTRSPWLCLAAAFAVYAGFSVVMSLAGQGPITVTDTQTGGRMAMALIVVLAALAVTTEYRFGTIRATFQAVPGRTGALLAKTAVVAVACGIVGLAGGLTAWLAPTLLAPDRAPGLETVTDWRTVLGTTTIFVFAAVIALSVGLLLRHTAGAIALLLFYTLQGELLVTLIPEVGEDIYAWLPFRVAQNMLRPDDRTGVLGPWGSLAYFAAFSLVLLAIALRVAKRRDA